MPGMSLGLNASTIALTFSDYFLGITGLLGSATTSTVH